MPFFRRAKAAPELDRAIAGGEDKRRASSLGLPSEVTGLPYGGTGDELPVTPDEAVQCTAISGALNVIAGRGCTLPLQRWRAEVELPAGDFLSHPEADSNITLTVTLWNTLADMCLAGVGYWRILVRDFNGFPLVIRRIEPRRCIPRYATVPGIGLVVLGWTIDGIEFAESEVLAFSGPNPRGWCVDAARAIRTAMALERAAKHYAEEPLPTIVLKKFERGRPPRRQGDRDTRPMETRPVPAHDGVRQSRARRRSRRVFGRRYATHRGAPAGGTRRLPG